MVKLALVKFGERKKYFFEFSEFLIMAKQQNDAVAVAMIEEFENYKKRVGKQFYLIYLTIIIKDTLEVTSDTLNLFLFNFLNDDHGLQFHHTGITIITMSGMIFKVWDAVESSETTEVEKVMIQFDENVASLWWKLMDNEMQLCEQLQVIVFIQEDLMGLFRHPQKH